jgi:hypothetical protein
VLSVGLAVAAIVAIVVGSNGGRQPVGDPSAEIRVAGPPETVFDWSRQACDQTDIPDAAARAFRMLSGQVNLVASYQSTRPMVGMSLNAVKHQCGVVMASTLDRRPEQFDDREWLASPYTEDGRTVFALVHDEYQGYRHPGRCESGLYLRCWYNAITLAISTDGGLSFRAARPPPHHLVASVPYPYIPDAGPYGLFQPSNIVRRQDGYYYALIRAAPFRDQRAGSCLMRTRTLGDPSSWRAWDGSGFGVEFADPYLRPQEPRRHVCQPVAPVEIASMSDSLTFNRYLGTYLLVGVAGRRQPGGGVVWGIYFSTSDDLVHWTQRKLIRETELPWTYQCGDHDPILDPSILDPSDGTRNFTDAGRAPYLYYVEMHYKKCVQSFDRDLVRVRVSISK